MNITVTGLAILDRLNVFFFKREAFEVSDLWRRAERSDGEIAGLFSKAGEVGRVLHVRIRCRVDVDRTEYKYLVGNAGRKLLGYCFSATNGLDLIVAETDVCFEVSV